jgi:hypothetical protein
MLEADARSKEIDSKRCRKFAKDIAEAIAVDSNNKGTFRKQIWNYLMEHGRVKANEYRDFLLAI